MLVIIIVVLSGSYVFGLWTLGAVGDLHGDRLTLLKRFVALSLNRTVMNEYVFTTLLGNEAIAFGVIKPFNRACYCFRHNFTLLLDYIKAGQPRPTLHIVG